MFPYSADKLRQCAEFSIVANVAAKFGRALHGNQAADTIRMYLFFHIVWCSAVYKKDAIGIEFCILYAIRYAQRHLYNCSKKRTSLSFGNDILNDSERIGNTRIVQKLTHCYFSDGTQYARHQYLQYCEVNS